MSRVADVLTHLVLAALAGAIGWGLLADEGTSAHLAMRVVAGYALACALLTLARALVGLAPSLAARLDRWYDEALNACLALLALTLAAVALSWDGGARLASLPLALLGGWLLVRTSLHVRRPS